MSSAAPIDITKDRLGLEDLAPSLTVTGGAVGVLGLAASLVLSFFQPEAFLRGYLLNLSFFTTLALGAMFFVLLHHITRAGWSVVVRRTAENMTAAFPLLALLFVPLVLMMWIGWPVAIRNVYLWTDAELAKSDHLLEHKSSYLNLGFYTLRMLIYFGAWIQIARYFRNNSIRQDDSGDPQLTARMQTLSAPAMLVYALTLTFWAFDTLMSLDPYWFSTIFGVYAYAGGLVGFFALLTLTTVLLQKAGRMSHSVTTEHYHDLGKLVFAFIIFWSYIAFSQYMLIWYGNLPEETGWYLVRHNMPWLALSLVLLFGHFVAPFLGLISRWPKRRKEWLVIGAVWVLVMHWCDIAWLVLPHRVGAAGQTVASASEAPVAGLGILDIVQCLTCLAGIGGLCFAAVARAMGSASLVPRRDPRLHESLEFKNT